MPTKEQEQKQMKDEETGTLDKAQKMPVPGEKPRPKTSEKFISPDDAEEHGYSGMRAPEENEYNGQPIVQPVHPAHELPKDKPKAKK